MAIKQYEVNHLYSFDQIDPDAQASILRKLREFNDPMNPRDVIVIYCGIQNTLKDWGFYYDMFNFKPGLCRTTSFMVKREVGV